MICWGCRSQTVLLIPRCRSLSQLPRPSDITSRRWTLVVCIETTQPEKVWRNPWGRQRVKHTEVYISSTGRRDATQQSATSYFSGLQPFPSTESNIRLGLLTMLEEIFTLSSPDRKSKTLQRLQTRQRTMVSLHTSSTWTFRP